MRFNANASLSILLSLRNPDAQSSVWATPPFLATLTATGKPPIPTELRKLFYQLDANGEVIIESGKAKLLDSLFDMVNY